jgi:hypothetical protein
MNFCATCGRRRTGDARFCDGCGTEFAAREAPATPQATATPEAPGAAKVPETAQAPETVIAPETSAAPEGAEPEAAEPTRWALPSTPTDWAPADWAPADATRAQPHPDATRIERLPDATRIERRPDATWIDPPDAAQGMTHGTAPSPSSTPSSTPPASPAEPDPFASWFAADPPESSAPPRNTPPRNDPPGQWQPAAGWQPADTEYAAPAQRGPAFPSPQPPYGGQQAQPPYEGQQAQPAGGKPSSGGRRAAFIIVLALVMLAVGGGAYAFVMRSRAHDSTAPPAPTVTASSQATPTAPASASAGASSSASASTSASATGSAAPGAVSLGPGVASNATEAAVEKTLTLYFDGINTHNYAEYTSSLDAQLLSKQTESQFNTGYGSTTDSGMTLTSLENTANGGQSATVTFTSHQNPDESVDHSPCNDWSLTFFLVPQGAGYLDGDQPANYHATHSDC